MWSYYLYCYRIDDADSLDHPSCGLDQIDLAELEFSSCAISFSDFLYRFWIENEIWFSVVPKDTRRTLNELELQYVQHYTSRRKNFSTQGGSSKPQST